MAEGFLKIVCYHIFKKVLVNIFPKQAKKIGKTPNSRCRNLLPAYEGHLPRAFVSCAAKSKAERGFAQNKLSDLEFLL